MLYTVIKMGRLLRKHHAGLTYHAAPGSVQQGFTFIEVMVAIMLLATFGISLFTVQTNILSKILMTHRQLVYSNDIQKEEFDYLMKLQQAILQKKSPDQVTIQTTKNNPARTVTVTMKPIAEESSLYKTFSKQVRILETKIAHDKYQDTWYSLVYIPELQDQKAGATPADNN